MTLRAIISCKLFLISILFSGFTQAGRYQDAVSQLGYSELAATFDQTKVAHLVQLAPASKFSFEEMQALALLRLLGAPIDERGEAQANFASFLHQYNQPDSAYLGNLGEASLGQRIKSRWQLQTDTPPSPFALELRRLIAKSISTGYNIITSPWPNFDTERQLVYGHNDIEHAQQLLVLLASEGVQARVGFSAKTSAFLYREDWGKLSQPLIDIGDGKRIVETPEFDLHFEFAQASDKLKFMEIINRYAKKNTADQPGLIHSAWWQPFYRSRTPAQNYQSVTQLLVSDGEETAVLLALNEKAELLQRDTQALNSHWQIRAQQVWVNPAFYRYLQGGFK